LNKRISDKDKKAWDNFINSKNKIPNKDKRYENKNLLYIEKTIDLHGYSLDDANLEIKKFIELSFEKGVTKISVITGKGSRSKNKEDPYQSKDLSILKYSVPNYLKENKDLMNKILKIDLDSIESPSKGKFDIILKKKNA
tara:strand:+ start:967 stop:1386 length:420 start_codon:yes stop_codon:yes gene_type:complete